LKRSTALAGAASLMGGPLSFRRVLGANDTIRLGIAGLHGRGGTHVKEFSGMQGVEVTYLIDPDTRTFRSRMQHVEKRTGRKPATTQDIRTALDDRNLDAVSVATTNHWHAPITIWACQAGKDVYVEKPASHNVHEGRVAVQVARKNQCIVQHGTQNRSKKSWAQLAEIARRGIYGKLLVSYGLCYKRRTSIGFKEPSPPPSELDFNMWLGPAPQQPHHGNLVHYNWHWFWDFGNGDIGNQGVHQMDIARWLIPGATLPRGVISVGGRFGYKDRGRRQIRRSPSLTTGRHS
jgi:predicted dehydrogenase